MSDTFLYHGEELHYFDHLYNLTMLNERRVELAIAHHWYAQHEDWTHIAGLEVGNVLGHYQQRNHWVFDLHEKAAWYQELVSQKVLNVDLLDLDCGDDPSSDFPWVVSISTIEHTEDPATALKVLKDLVAPGGNLLVTFPSGVDYNLDWVITLGGRDIFDRACTLTRIAGGNEWTQDEKPVVSPYGQWANSVFIGEWTRSA